MLKEQEGVKEEVENLRRLMEENGRREEHEREMERERERDSQRNGRESPVARMLEREEQRDEEGDDDDDARSIASVDTVVEAPSSPSKNKKRQVNGTSPLDSEETTSEPTSIASPAPPSTSQSADSDELARERLVLQEQNAALTARLDALSAELDEAIQLGRSLQTQHSETLSTIKLLEEKIASLETAVDERVEEAQGKVMRECEERWKGWKEVFEEGWRREKEGWREEREKLWEVVKDWEEKKKRESEAEADAGEVESDGSEEDDEAEGESSTAAQSTSSTARSPSPKKRSTRRRKRTTIVPTTSASIGGSSSSSSSSTNSIPTISRNLASSLAANENLASDSDSTIGGEAGSKGGDGVKQVPSGSEGASSGLRSSKSPVSVLLFFHPWIIEY